MVTGTYISIITLNVNGLNATTKRHRLAEWIQKQDPYICCLQETHFRPRDTYRQKVRGWKKIFHANGNQKKAGGASLVAQWLRVCLLMQGTRVWALVWEDPTCHGATGPVSQLLSLRVWSLCSTTRGRDSERPAHRDEEWPPLAAAGESPRTETKTKHSQK